MKTTLKITNEIKPSKFYKKQNSRSLSPLAPIETGRKSIKNRKHKENLLGRRKGQILDFQPYLSDENDELEQRILKWLEDKNITMVLPDEKEHEYLQSNITNIFRKFDKNYSMSLQNSNSNSSSPSRFQSTNSISPSPQLNMHNSPLMQKRKENVLGEKFFSSLIKVEKIADTEESKRTSCEKMTRRNSKKIDLDFFQMDKKFN